MDRCRVNIVLRPRRIVAIEYVGGGELEVTLATGDTLVLDEDGFALLTGIDWEEAAAERAMEEED